MLMDVTLIVAIGGFECPLIVQVLLLKTVSLSAEARRRSYIFT